MRDAYNSLKQVLKNLYITLGLSYQVVLISNLNEIISSKGGKAHLSMKVGWVGPPREAGQPMESTGSSQGRKHCHRICYSAKERAAVIQHLEIKHPKLSLNLFKKNKFNR